MIRTASPKRPPFRVARTSPPPLRSGWKISPWYGPTASIRQHRLPPSPPGEGFTMNEEALFAAALEKSNPAERQAFLDEACGGDIGLRQRLERLLAADEQTAGILSRGAAAVL